MSHCWHLGVSIMASLLVSASQCHFQHQLNQEAVNWYLLFWIWYVTYVHNLHGVPIIAGTISSVSKHDCRYQLKQKWLNLVICHIWLHQLRSHGRIFCRGMNLYVMYMYIIYDFVWPIFLILHPYLFTVKYVSECQLHQLFRNFLIL